MCDMRTFVVPFRRQPPPFGVRLLLDRVYAPGRALYALGRRYYPIVILDVFPGVFPGAYTGFARAYGRSHQSIHGIPQSIRPANPVIRLQHPAQASVCTAFMGQYREPERRIEASFRPDSLPFQARTGPGGRPFMGRAARSGHNFMPAMAPESGERGLVPLSCAAFFGGFRGAGRRSRPRTRSASRPAPAAPMAGERPPAARRHVLDEHPHPPLVDVVGIVGAAIPFEGVSLVWRE